MKRWRHVLTAVSRVTLVIALGGALLTLATANAPAGEADGFKSLFNGKDLTGWEGKPEFWSVQDGAITGKTTAENPTKGNTFLIWKDGTLSDFVLKLKFKIVGGNSGIQYRSSERKEHGDFVVGGYQADFEAGDKPAGDVYSGILYEEKGRGILAKRGEKTVVGEDGKPKVVGSVGDSQEIASKIKKEDWNDYEIIADGNHLIHKINGLVTADVTDEQPEKAAKEGLLALQLHAGPPMVVQFKDILLKVLPASAPDKSEAKAAGAKKIVIVAGTPSHKPGDHEFNAGALLLKKCLDKIPGIHAVVYQNGWPKDEKAFDGADAICFYMDGGARHPMIQGDHLIQLNKLMQKGVGIACLHYAVEVPADRGGPELLQWVGGYYETGYSINPHWDAELQKIPEHAITRGVKPFSINDEWYYNIRFNPDPSLITPILIATPPDASRKTKAAAEFPGRPETIAWVISRPEGGRGFGFTGGHFHKNWGDDNFRKFVLNALVWVAKGDIPTDGIPSKVTEEELGQNLDPKGKK